MRTPPAWWPPAAALAVALLGFQLVFGLRLLSANDAYWSNPPGDMGQMLAGELAGLRAPWSLPILTPDTLIAPDRVSLVYTDSIPWLTALLKLTHLGRTFSLLGTFLLLSWLAQPAAMYALLRASGVRRATTLLAGALLALLAPAWLGRQIGHIALSGHAIQIAALALAVRSIRGGLDGAGVAGFFALGVLSVGVHAYHVPPVTLMFATALASDVLQRRAGAVRRMATAGPGFLAVLVAAAWVCGYFVGRGGSGGIAALGYYEMNLVAPVWPQGSALAGQKWTGGWFTHVFDPTGGEVYEGYDYLGAGVLLVLASAGLLLWRARRSTAATVVWSGPSSAPASDAAPRDPAVVDGTGSWARRWGPLAAALGLLTLYAVGAKPYVGTVQLFALPLPDRPWMEPFALFRCHGRFFWTVGYALVAGGLAVVDRLSGVRLRLAVLAAAVLLQAADMSQMLWGLHDRFSRPEPLHAPAALAGPAFDRRDLRIFPGFFCTDSFENMTRMRQLSLLAQRHHASTNVAETARAPTISCPVPEPDLLADARPDDRRVTVVLWGDVMPVPVTNAFAARTDCFAYREGAWFCGRDLDGVPGLRRVPGTDLLMPTVRDAVLDIAGPALRAGLVSGWSKPEPTGVWSDGSRAVLRLPHPDLPHSGVLTVSLDALTYQPPGRAPQRVRVSLPDGPVTELVISGGEYATAELRLPAGRLRPGPVELTLDFPDALSPNAVLPGSGDPRRLGIGVRRVTLAH